MLRNYFKTAWRNIRKNKVYSVLTIAGLAAGMAVALLIGLWVHNEYQFDRFLPGYKQAYQVKRNYNSNGDTLTFATVSLKLAESLRNVPGIEYLAESDWMGSHALTVGETKVYVAGALAGKDFLKIFRYPFKKGDANTVFNDAYSIVLTESMAKSLFGDVDPINKMVRFDNRHDLRVTGILEDLPANSTLQFYWVVPFTYLDQTDQDVRTARTASYSWNAYQIFIKLKDGVNEADVASRIRKIQHSEPGNINAINSFVFLEPIKDWHLYGKYENGKVAGGFIQYVRMFTIIGLLVLLIACINFINLTTARSEKRAREVGLRKAIGSLRKDLIIQFLIESFLLTFLSFILSIGLVLLVLPAFNQLTGRDIDLPVANGMFWLVMLSCLLITAFMAGSRPAFYLSSFQPVRVLKGSFKAGKSASLPRKILVVLQFSCSIALIISTIIIYQQIQHARNRPMGYDINRVIVSNTNEELSKNYGALKNELLQKNIVSSLTYASSPATNIYWHSDVEEFPGKQAGETVEMGVVITGTDYFKTLGMQFKEGRDFTSELDSTSVVMNEAAARLLRLKDPVSQVINFQGTKLTVAGVVKDALMVSPFANADPTIFLCGRKPEGNLIYQLSPTIPTQQAITQLTQAFNKYNPGFPYNYQFADEDYAAKFELEVLIGKLSGVFAVLAILISCLGLFGLAAYIAEQRTKEIGVRKVLGASVSQVWLLLSKDFILLVLISCCIASPLAFYFLNNWLQDYDYRVTIGIWVFIFSALVAIIITIATISFQAIKAAVSNPVTSLRTE